MMFALRPEARGEGTEVGGKCSGEKRKAAALGGGCGLHESEVTRPESSVDG